MSYSSNASKPTVIEPGMMLLLDRQLYNVVSVLAGERQVTGEWDTTIVLSTTFGGSESHETQIALKDVVKLIKKGKLLHVVDPASDRPQS